METVLLTEGVLWCLQDKGTLLVISENHLEKETLVEALQAMPDLMEMAIGQTKELLTIYLDQANTHLIFMFQINGYKCNMEEEVMGVGHLQALILLIMVAPLYLVATAPSFSAIGLTKNNLISNSCCKNVNQSRLQAITGRRRQKRKLGDRRSPMAKLNNKD